MNRPPVTPCALVADLESALEDLTLTWPDEWLAAPITTRGMDEVSGLLARPEHAFDIAVRLNEHIWPLRFRLALADSADASAMDGPAFHRAAELHSVICARWKRSRHAPEHLLGPRSRALRHAARQRSRPARPARPGRQTRPHLMLAILDAPPPTPRTADAPRFDTSVVIGKCENLNVLSFLLAGELAGIALIFAAKSLVRSDAIREDPSFYLGGTMVNLCWSLAVGFATRLVCFGSL